MTIIITTGNTQSPSGSTMRTGSEFAFSSARSTSGPISDDELFYLKSRGINDNDSRKLIVEGFLADVLARFGNSAVLDQLVARIEEKLQRV